MHITIEKLRQTEAYKKNGVSYPHPTHLIDECFMSTIRESFTDLKNLNIQVDKEGGAITENKENIITWGRGLITISTQFENKELGISHMFGLIWSYDTSKPIIKVFSGATVWACTNLSVSADKIIDIPVKLPVGSADTPKQKERAMQRAIEDIEDAVIDATYKLVSSAESDFNAFANTLLTFKSTKLFLMSNLFSKDRDYNLNLRYDSEKPQMALEPAIGLMYINDLIRGTFDYSTFNFAFQILFDPNFSHPKKHLYYRDGNGEPVSLWEIHNAMTQRLTDGKVEIDYIPNKSAETITLLTHIVEYLKIYNKND